MEKQIGDLIGESRTKLGLTQEQFGRRYNVSGPAIFKFEKAYVKPSLDLWLRMSKDIGLTEQQAVVMHVKARLPKRFQDFLTPKAPVAREAAKAYGKKKGRARSADPKTARKTLLADTSTPRGLKALLKDGDMVDLYKPTAEELYALKDVFGPLGPGTKSAYRQALRLVRDLRGGDKM